MRPNTQKIGHFEIRDAEEIDVRKRSADWPIEK